MKGLKLIAILAILFGTSLAATAQSTVTAPKVNTKSKYAKRAKVVAQSTQEAPAATTPMPAPQAAPTAPKATEEVVVPEMQVRTKKMSKLEKKGGNL